MRLEEFILFYEGHVVDHPWEREDLAELIAQSANDAIVNGSLSEGLRDRVIQFFHDRHCEFPYQWKYWTELAENPEFPIAALLRIA